MQNVFSGIPVLRSNVLWDALAGFSMRLCAALLILGIGWWISLRVARWLRQILTRQARVDATLRPILYDTSLWGIRVVAIVGALSQLGI
ncbi:hypothetical protein R75461_07655 [Paraburkholderia nemoris]|nr:hypothetical protein R75461_07655 [Paraburkholderia nemoris]